MSVSEMIVGIAQMGEEIDILHTSFDSFARTIRLSLQQYKQSIQHDIQLLTQHLVKEINRGEEKNKQLCKMMDRVYRNWKEEGQQYQDTIEGLREEVQVYRSEAEEYRRKYEEVGEASKKSEQDFMELMEEMKSLKQYVEEFKLQSNDSCNSLTKMSSVENLEHRHSQYLDTIKEVTEQSVHSDTEEENPEGRISALTLNIDIGNVSQELEKDAGLSIMDSLNILKNYHSEETCTDIGIALPAPQQLEMPKLEVSNVLPYRILYQADYQYVGNICEMVAEGFGKLFRGDTLIYCGEWKNGLWHGWGRLYPHPPDIQEISGKFSEGVLQGSTKVVFSDGSHFVGTFLEGQVNGEGTYIKSNIQHRGQWYNNHLHKKL